MFLNINLIWYTYKTYCNLYRTFTPVRDSINCSVIGEASDRDRALQRDDLHIRLAKAK